MKNYTVTKIEDKKKDNSGPWATSGTTVRWYFIRYKSAKLGLAEFMADHSRNGIASDKTEILYKGRGLATIQVTTTVYYN